MDEREHFEEPLTESQCAELEQALRVLQAETERALRGADGDAKPVELDQTAVGRLSRMDAMQQQAMAKAALQRRQVLLQQCQAALRAIGEGSYGQCRRCEEEIGYKRLTANPAAPLCLRCQGGMPSQ